MSGAGLHLKRAIGLVALLAAAAWLGVLPSLREARALKTRIAAARASLELFESKADDIRSLADTLTEARVFAASHTKPIQDLDVSALMSDIGRFLTTISVTSHEMKQDRTVERDGVRVTPVTLTMRATFLDLAKLLDHLERSERLMRIARVQVDLPRGAAPGSPTLLIEVDIESISPLGAPKTTYAAAGGEDER